MEALIEAILVFVAIPAGLLASLALAIYGAAVAARSLATPARTTTRIVADPAKVVAFTPRRTQVTRDVRKAA
jgi:hypothetical protein